MKVEVPMVVCHRSPRLIEAALPHLGRRHQGPSLGELRDDLALEVMLAFESSPVSLLRRFQLAPHMRLRYVELELKVHDQERGVRRNLEGAFSVLLEKWPSDAFWIATPTHAPQWQFAVRAPEALPAALRRRVIERALAEELESLEGLTATRRERLDVLEVDADPPSVLPRTPKPPAKPRRKTSSGAARGASEPARAGAARAAAEEPVETPAEREERRRRARLMARVLREATRNLSHGVHDRTLERAFGREALVEGLVDEIVGSDGVAIALIGDSGVGKTAIVHEVVRRLAARYGATGQRRDVWRLDGSRFIAGQSYIGQWEARARNLCQELTDTGDLLHADDLASLVFAGRTSKHATNLAQYLEPFLARGEVSLIGECTPERFELVRELAPAFAANFRVVRVPAMSTRETLPALLGVLRDLESEPDGDLPPRLSPAALELLLDSAGRFRPHEAFPGRAVRLLRRVLAGQGELDYEANVRRFGVDEVWETLRAETGLPDHVLGASEPHSRKELTQELAADVAGQPEAVSAIVEAILAMQGGLCDPDKPVATYLLIGPTGVGKTETAKALARHLFGSDERLLRFDMSEFASPASVARLVGQAGGVDGELTSALRAQPLRVILFDEVEKAHPRVFDALLQLTGEGRLTDAYGRTADARQAVVLMTSNLGVREAATSTGFSLTGDASRQHYLSAVRAFFRPEFFNRIDRVVPYRALDQAALRVVVSRALEELLSRRGVQRGRVVVDVEPAVLEGLIQRASDPRYGARPLKRLLERNLTVPLASHLATRRGDDLALVELYERDGELALTARLLADAPLLPLGEQPSTWDLERLAAEVESLRGRLAALPRPAEEDQARDHAEVSQELGELDEDRLAGIDWLEEERAAGPDLDPRGLRRAGHMGLRPKPTYRETRVRANAEAQLRWARDHVTSLRDRVEVMELRAKAAAHGDEVGALIFECVGFDGHYANVVRMRVEGLLGIPWSTLLWVEHPLHGELTWERMPRDDSGAVQVRRVAYEVSASWVQPLMPYLCGWSLYEDRESGMTCPVRISWVPGSMPEAAHALDTRLVEERTARRRGDDTPPELVQFRGDDPHTHVATGLNSRQHQLAIIAACLRGAR
ncbi:MAG: AAA family ATPase [Kofleriaceae bacterium]